MGLSRMAAARYLARQSQFDGEVAVELADLALGLTATIIPGFGSNLISFSRQADGRDYIYSPPSLAELRLRPVRYGNPVLLPPNRIRGARFQFEGRTYILPCNRPPHHSHGLVHSLPWRFSAAGAGEHEGAWVRTSISTRDERTFADAFPHDFLLALTFVLREGRLSLSAVAENRGPGKFPFGLGYHTYFRLPMTEGEDLAGYRLTLPARKRWELDACFPTGRLLTLAEHERLEAKPVRELRLDDVYTDLAPGEPEIAARLWHEGSGAGIEFVSDRAFPHWVIWNGPEPEAPFVCLEPYTCVTDAPNLPLPRETTGLVALGEGEVWRGRVEFRPFG